MQRRFRARKEAWELITKGAEHQVGLRLCTQQATKIWWQGSHGKWMSYVVRSCYYPCENADTESEWLCDLHKIIEHVRGETGV